MGLKSKKEGPRPGKEEKQRVGDLIEGDRRGEKTGRE